MSEVNYFSQENSQIFNDACRAYLEEFKVKSGGFDLGPVYHFGDFRKSLGETKKSLIFFSIPIKNQESYISEVLDDLFKNCKYPYSVGLLFDNCTDKSLENVLEYLQENFSKVKCLTLVSIFVSNGELFEATCENLLLKFCEANYFVSLQADNFLNDETFLTRALKIFKELPNLLGISARACVSVTPKLRYLEILHNVADTSTRILNNLFRFKKYIKLGSFYRYQSYFGDKSLYGVSHMQFSERDRNTLFIGEAIIRGPIIWDSAKLKKLNGFDDVNFYLGRDDCDVSLRAKKFDWIVGYLPATSYSIPTRGTTRRPRSFLTEEALQQRNLISSISKTPMEIYWNLQKIFYIKFSRVMGDRFTLPF